jgi:hypothetical protein
VAQTKPGPKVDAGDLERKGIVMSIIERLRIPIATREELPKTFSALTHPLSVSAEPHIIESIWSTLRGAPVMATLEGSQLVFWRKWISQLPPSKQHTGFVETR